MLEPIAIPSAPPSSWERTSSGPELAAYRRRPHQYDAAGEAIWTGFSKVLQAPLELGSVDGITTKPDRRLVGARSALAITGALEQFGMGGMQRLVALERRIAQERREEVQACLRGCGRSKPACHRTSDTPTSGTGTRRPARRWPPGSGSAAEAGEQARAAGAAPSRPARNPWGNWLSISRRARASPIAPPSGDSNNTNGSPLIDAPVLGTYTPPAGLAAASTTSEARSCIRAASSRRPTAPLRQAPAHRPRKRRESARRRLAETGLSLRARGTQPSLDRRR